MAFSKADLPPSPTHFYAPLPSWQNEQEEDHEGKEHAIVLPFYPLPTVPGRRKWPFVLPVFLLLLLSGIVYVFWPSDPTLKIVRLRLNKIHIHTLPIINIDISLYVTLQVRNVDAYSLDFRNLDVAVKYRGKGLGHVRSDRGHVRAFASSFVDAELDFSGVGVLSDVVSLLDDLAKGAVPFSTVTEVSGKLGLLWFEFPLKANVSCEVLVNTKNQTIVRQTCYPEVSRDELVGLQSGTPVQHELRDSLGILARRSLNCNIHKLYDTSKERIPCSSTVS